MKKKLMILSIALVAAVSFTYCDALDEIADAAANAAGYEVEAIGSCGSTFEQGGNTIGACLQDSEGEYLQPVKWEAADKALTTQCGLVEASGTQSDALSSDDSQCPTTNSIGTCTYTVDILGITYDYEMVMYGSADVNSEVDDTALSGLQSSAEVVCDLVDFATDTTWTPADPNAE